MSNAKKRIEELNLIEDFLFTEATIDEKTSQLLMRLIIERAIGLKVGKLVIEAQKVINGVDTDCHGIRLDVSVKEVRNEDDKTVRLFDIEPNNIKDVHLPKRSRYYQALSDVKLLDAGVDYDLLPDMWTIWILPYDPFGFEYMLYSVKNIVEECPEIEYNDGVRKIFLYTKGKNGGTQALKDLLTYMQNSNEENAVDEELRKLHSNVNRLKHSKEIGVKYMQMYEVIKYKVKEEVEERLAEIRVEMKETMREEVKEEVREEVKEEVREEVKEEVREEVLEEIRQEELRMSKLMQKLLDEARYEELRKISTDMEYRKKLLAENKV